MPKKRIDSNSNMHFIQRPQDQVRGLSSHKVTTGTKNFPVTAPKLRHFNTKKLRLDIDKNKEREIDSGSGI
jgi:hypothetical protein